MVNVKRNTKIIVSIIGMNDDERLERRETQRHS